MSSKHKWKPGAIKVIEKNLLGKQFISSDVADLCMKDPEFMALDGPKKLLAQRGKTIVRSRILQLMAEMANTGVLEVVKREPYGTNGTKYRNTYQAPGPRWKGTMKIEESKPINLEADEIATILYNDYVKAKRIAQENIGRMDQIGQENIQLENEKLTLEAENKRLEIRIASLKKREKELEADLEKANQKTTLKNKLEDAPGISIGGGLGNTPTITVGGSQKERQANA